MIAEELYEETLRHATPGSPRIPYLYVPVLCSLVVNLITRCIAMYRLLEVRLTFSIETF
jgi:hypothetical protein